MIKIILHIFFYNSSFARIKIYFKIVPTKHIYIYVIFVFAIPE